MENVMLTKVAGWEELKSPTSLIAAQRIRNNVRLKCSRLMGADYYDPLGFPASRASRWG
jgi:hypothetical protein